MLLKGDAKMPITKAQQRANTKYVKNNYDTTLIRVKKDAKTLIAAAAKERGESFNGYVKRAIKAQYEAETGKTIEL